MAQGGDDPVLRRHIDQCPECQGELATLEQLARFKKLTGGQLAEIPAARTAELSMMLRKLRPDLGGAKASEPTVVDRIRTLWAELLHDTGGQLQLAGLRSDSNPDTRQIAFVSDIADLDLEVSTVNDQQMIVGQLGMDELPTGLTIKFVPSSEDPLQAGANEGQSGRIDDQGYFKVQLDSGKWIAVLRLDDAVILFPEVQL